MTTKYLTKLVTILCLFAAVGVIVPNRSAAQVTGGNQEIKWLSVGPLAQYFSNCASEIEYGRRGRGPYLNTDQDDGLRWDNQYQFQDHSVGKSLWIGCTNFKDPSTGLTYPYKVICLGRSIMFMNSVVFPVKFQLIGKFDHPSVLVDGQPATNLDANDLNLTGGEDQVDPALPSDRMIYNQANTPVGITIYRKVYNWTQQYNNNYFIYEYVFKNTGLTDNAGGTMPPATLTGVMFYFTYRFAAANDAYRLGVGYSGDQWGRNTIDDAIGQDANHTLAAPNDFRAIFEYYGPNATATSVSDCIGRPDFNDGHILYGTGFTGEMVLHADKSSHDQSDDPTQPTTTWYTGSDGLLQTISPSSPFNPDFMTQQYGLMTLGHPAQTQAEALGEDADGWPNNYASTWTGSPAIGLTTGGYQSEQGFGPYTLAPGDSVRIVICEAVAGISHDFSQEVARNWWNWYHNHGNTPLQLPSKAPAWKTPTWTVGGTTTDGDIYKNAWVFTGKDSLLQTFRRARDNYNSSYGIPQPPPPPDGFRVTSGGNMITLQWSTSAESAPHFNGYLIYRADTKTDTIFTAIDSCDASTLSKFPAANGFRTYLDKSPKRGFNYFYYVQTKDDGSTNTVEPGVPLVSSKFYTMTNTPAFLMRPEGGKPGSPDQYSLSAIRVVPNPYNISARAIQFGTDISVWNRIAFFNLPSYCIIRIFTENGDLVQTINHTNGSGDETWDLLTSSAQVVASGLYIAYFEVTSGPVADPHYKIGQSIYKKFIVIR
ncbi:MAG TPA: hypothetical protein VLX91_07980 [Candidatus Acidoferrales bacterium]|nr:hypothetical protein [Candidatus Acidoferrales bacterium]